jgi:hypothetical protein
VCAQSTIGSELDCSPSSEEWSRLGESNPGPAHYEFVDERCQCVHSRPDQGFMFVWGPGWTGWNGMQLQLCVQPLALDRDLAGDPPVRARNRKYVAVYDKAYTTLI